MRPRKDLRVSVRCNVGRVADVHAAHVALIDVDQDPHFARVGNGEALRGAGQQQLSGPHQAFDDFSADGRRTGIWSVVAGLTSGSANAQHAQRVAHRFHIGLRLRPVGFGLLQIALGDGLMCVEILRALIVFVGQLEDIVFALR
jgi:hypothetical protein